MSAIVGQKTTSRQTGSGVQNQVYWLSSYLYWGDLQKLEDKTDWTQTGDQERWYQESHFWTPSTNKHKIDWDSAECVTYSTNYQQRLTLESWYTNSEKEPLNRCQQLPAPYKRLKHDLKQNRPTNNRQIENSQTTTDQSPQLMLMPMMLA